MFRIRAIKIISITLLALLLIVGKRTYKKMRFVSSYKSPNKKYELVIKRAELISNFIPAMPGQGGLGAKSIIVILKCKGKEINRSQESLLYQDLEIKWNLKQNKVYYSRPHYFDLLEKIK